MRITAGDFSRYEPSQDRTLERAMSVELMAILAMAIICAVFLLGS
jgi:hypothetical protein